MRVLVRRNIRLFFRDRGAVFFSLLAVCIILLLYAVFLGDVWLDDSMGEMPGAETLMHSWLAAGILAVASVTATMGAFGVMIDDQTKKIYKDFYAAPIKRAGIAGGYLAGAYCIGVLLSLVTALAAQLYIVARGGTWLSTVAWAKIVGLVLLATVTNTSLVCCIVSGFRSHSAFSTASTILGTLIGFLTGIYLPIGALPAPVQTVIKVFPVSHAAVLFRRVLMEDAMAEVLGGAPPEVIDGFREYMGITFRFGTYEMTPLVSILILAGTAVLCYCLSLLSLSRRKRWQ